MLFANCSTRYYCDSLPIGYKEYCHDYGTYRDSCCYLQYDTSTHFRWYYACDSILVCNANLVGLGCVSMRKFSSTDIALNRSFLGNQTRYFEIEEVTEFNITTKNKAFKYTGFQDLAHVVSTSERCLFRMYIPILKRKGLRKKKSYYQIPITYLGDEIFLHQNKLSDTITRKHLKEYLFNIMDSTSVLLWEKECLDGTVIIEAPVVDKYGRIMF